MYWPVGTPRIYATSSSQPANFNVVVSNDGVCPPSPDDKDTDKADQASLLTTDSASSLDVPAPAPVPATPLTPSTPFTPRIKSVEHDLFDSALGEASSNGLAPASIPLKEPILALRVSRLGQVFAVITATSMTIWQAKVRLRQGTWQPRDTPY